MYIRDPVENLLTHNREEYSYDHSKYRWKTKKLKAERESTRYEDIQILHSLKIIIRVPE